MNSSVSNSSSRNFGGGQSGNGKSVSEHNSQNNYLLGNSKSNIHGLKVNKNSMNSMEHRSLKKAAVLGCWY